MKYVAMMLIAALLLPCPAIAVDYSPLAGVWRAEMFGVPAFVLTISDEGGELTGAILFYKIRRNQDGSSPRAEAGDPEPLFGMRFDGRTLQFRVSHRRAHPPRTANDPPVGFRMQVTGAGRARLSGESSASPGEAPLELRRDAQ